MVTARKVWTLPELHSLPDDGNKYELIHGELLVTPPPAGEHEEILARLSEQLGRLVTACKLGRVYHPRAVVQFKGSEVEPDLMVRKPHPRPQDGWEAAPIPMLVVEVISPSTRRRDREQKKQFYLETGVAEYWIVDPEARAITVIRADDADRVALESLTWMPPGMVDGIEIRVADIFG